MELFVVCIYKRRICSGEVSESFEGTVLDVAVDARPESETFGQFVMVELSDENKRQLYASRIFAWFLRNFRISYFFINVIITIINYQKRGSSIR